MAVFWISRHPLTEGQARLIEQNYGVSREDIVHANITFPYDGNTADLLDGIGAKATDVVCIVAPTYVMVDLLNVGYRLVEFVNEPSSRQKGKFLCRGAFIYAIVGEEISKTFIPCPLSLEEQEEVDIM